MSLTNINDSDMSMNIGNADDAQSGAELLPGVELRTMALWIDKIATG